MALAQDRARNRVCGQTIWYCTETARCARESEGATLQVPTATGIEWVPEVHPQGDNECELNVSDLEIDRRRQVLTCSTYGARPAMTTPNANWPDM